MSVLLLRVYVGVCGMVDGCVVVRVCGWVVAGCWFGGCGFRCGGCGVRGCFTLFFFWWFGCMGVGWGVLVVWMFGID